MKKLFTTFIIAAFCSFSLCIFAQDTTSRIISTWQRDMLKPNAKFYDIQKKLNTYFETNPDTNEPSNW